MGQTVFAIFDDLLAAQRVAGALELEGYEREGISVLVPDPRNDYAQPPIEAAAIGRAGNRLRGREGPERALGLAPIDVPGLGPAAVLGPLAELLAEADAGGLVRALTGLGFPDPKARHYYESLRRGQVIVGVEAAESRIRRAEEVMRRLGARAVDATDFMAGTLPPESELQVREAAPDGVTVPVFEEHLEVGKRQVNRGGIRVNRQIVEEPVEESVRLREERLTVERRTVNREATEEDLANFKEGTFEIHETVEEPVITKRRRVVEEIVIGRETRERVQKISETIRKTQVNLEPLPGAESPVEPPAKALDLRALHEAGPLRTEEFEQFEPAYRYGTALARDERYGRVKWSEVEPDARRAWEEQNPGTWGDYRSAVRHAWDLVTGH